MTWKRWLLILTHQFLAILGLLIVVAMMSDADTIILTASTGELTDDGHLSPGGARDGTLDSVYLYDGWATADAYAYFGLFKFNITKIHGLDITGANFTAYVEYENMDAGDEIRWAAHGCVGNQTWTQNDMETGNLTWDIFNFQTWCNTTQDYDFTLTDPPTLAKYYNWSITSSLAQAAANNDVNYTVFINVTGVAGTLTIDGIRVTSLDEVSNHPQLIVTYSSGTTTTSSTTTTTTPTTTTTLWASHPKLLFSDFTTTSGYKYQGATPWSGWKTDILGDSDVHCNALDYLLTGDTTELNAAVNALLTLDTTAGTASPVHGARLLEACLAYDWIAGNISAENASAIENNIAQLADNIYNDTNTFDFAAVDYTGQVYAAIACAGACLEGYSNASLYSQPSDWLNIGTSNWFTQDTHSDSGTMSSKAFTEWVYDPLGNHLLAGSYDAYTVHWHLAWYKIYSHYFKKNISDDYQIAREVIMNQVWSSMPNRLPPNVLLEAGMSKYYPYRTAAYLLDPTNRSYVLRWYEDLKNEVTFPFEKVYALDHDNYYDSVADVFITYENYTNPANPPWTAHFDKDSFYQTMRSDWTRNASWIGFITWNHTVEENRPMSHGDQFNVDYYDKGDYLIGDSGEVVDRAAGHVATDGFHHNVLLVSKVNDDMIYAFRKGVAAGFTLYHPTARVTQYLTNPSNFDFIEAQVDDLSYITNETTTQLDTATNTNLAVPLTWRRGVAFTKDYFILFDYMNNSGQRIIEKNIPLKTASFNATVKYVNNTGLIINSSQPEANFTIKVDKIDSPSLQFKSWIMNDTGTGTLNYYINGHKIGVCNIPESYAYFQSFNASYAVVGWNNITVNTSDAIEVGIGGGAGTRNTGMIFVVGVGNGTLYVEGAEKDWETPLLQTDSAEVEGYDIKWNTTTRYGQDISMHLYSLPKSNISYRKQWTKMGGITTEAYEPDMPVVRFKTNTSDSYYGITAFYTLFDGSPYWFYSDLGLSGAGEAMAVSNGTWTDTITHSDGNAITAGNVKTDASYSVTRNDTPTTIDFVFARNAQYFNFSGQEIFNCTGTGKLDYLLYDYVNSSFFNVTAAASTPATILFNNLTAGAWAFYWQNGTLWDDYAVPAGNTSMVVNFTFSSELSGYGDSGAPAPPTTTSTTSTSTTSTSTTSTTTTSPTTTTLHPGPASTGGFPAGEIILVLLGAGGVMLYKMKKQGG